MNHIKFYLKNDVDQLFYCVLSKDVDFTTQFETVFAIKKGYGFLLFGKLFAPTLVILFDAVSSKKLVQLRWLVFYFVLFFHFICI